MMFYLKLAGLIVGLLALSFIVGTLILWAMFSPMISAVPSCVKNSETKTEDKKL